MYISLLTDDYLKPSGRFTRNFVKESREAPAVFKYNGKYYMLSSGCTGWDPNIAEMRIKRFMPRVLMSSLLSERRMHILPCSTVGRRRIWKIPVMYGCLCW